MRIWETTDRPVSEVPPHLTGCQVTFRHRINAAETDIEAIIQTVNEELIPGLREMDGFVLYGWLGTPDGRISFNIWETAEQLAAGDAYVAEFVATHPIITTNGEPRRSTPGRSDTPTCWGTSSLGFGVTANVGYRSRAFAPRDRIQRRRSSTIRSACVSLADVFRYICSFATNAARNGSSGITSVSGSSLSGCAPRRPYHLAACSFFASIIKSTPPTSSAARTQRSAA